MQTKLGRNIYVMDIYYSDAYKNGLLPLIDQIIKEINSSMNDEESSDSLARKTCRIRELYKLQNRIRGIAEYTQRNGHAVMHVKYFTKFAEGLALLIQKVKQAFDTLCRKSR